MDVLQITDGEKTVDFRGGDFHLQAWSPAVTKRAADTLLNSPYENVTERMIIDVKDFQNMQLLTELLDQVQRWRRGETVRPVQLHYKPTATSALLVALIVGVSSNMLRLPDAYGLGETVGLIDPVVIEFERSGQWLIEDRTNLIDNGGFEDWTGGEPDDWTVDITLTIEEETTIVHEGESSLKVTGASGIDTGVSQDITVPLGATIKVSAWVYKSSVGGVIGIVADDGAGSVRSGGTLIQNQWQYIEFDYTPAVGGSDNVNIKVGGLAGTPTNGYIDAVQVVPLDTSGVPGDVAADTAVDNGDVAELNFATGQERYPSPTRISLTNFRYGTNHPRSFVVVSNNPAGIIPINAGGLTMVTNFTQVTDTAAFAKGDTIMRYTPPDTAMRSISFITWNQSLSGIKRLAIFASVRNNSTTTQFTMFGRSFTPSGEVRTRPVIVPGQATPAPYWVYLGDLPLGRLSTFFVAVEASAASGTLDIDEFVIVSLDDGLTAAVAIDPSQSTGSSNSAVLVVNHGALSLPAPRVELEVSGQIDAWSARGQIAIYTDAPQIAAILLATGGDSSVNRWRQVASTAVVENDWVASRLPGRIVPE